MTAVSLASASLLEAGARHGAEGAYAFGVAAALGAAALWAFGSHLFQRALVPVPGRARLTPAAANLFKNASAGALFAVAWHFLGQPVPDLDSWLRLMLSGFLGFALGDAMYFAAFPRCGVQLAALCANLIPPLAALLDWALYGQALGGTALACMAVTIGGIALVVSERPRTRHDRPAPDPKVRMAGIALAAGAAACQSVAIVTGRVGFAGAEIVPGTVARLSGGVLGALLLAVLLGLWQRARAARGAAAERIDGPVRGPAGELRLLARPFLIGSLAVLLVPACLVGAWLNLPLHSTGIAHLPSGVSAILFATVPLFALPIGLALGERYGLRTALGTAIAFAGVVGVIRFT